RFTVRHFSTVVISAVAASVVGRAAFGDTAAFAIPFEFGVNSLWEYLLYPVLGVLAALVGVLFTRSLYGFEDLFDRWRRPPEWVKPAIGGALLGVLALAYPLVRLTQPVTWERMPQVFNVGYEVIESVLANEVLLGAALVLLIAKILATNLTLGSGGSGGIFAPSLFMGAMLGAAFELAINRFFPGIVAPPGAYAIIGMGAVFAAAAHAPITAIIILFELTGDYRIILPLMLTVVIATLVSQRLLRGESIYTLKLTRRGIRLHRGRDQDILQSVQVGEVMTEELNTVKGSVTIEEVSSSYEFSHSRSLMVLDDQGLLIGIVTLSDLERAFGAGRSPDTEVAAIATTWPHLQVTYPNESVGAALAKMGSRGIGQLPVVSRRETRQLRGKISRIGITKAYTLALSQRSEVEHRSAELERRYQDEAGFVEITLAPTDTIIGKQLKEVAHKLPKDCILVSIQRGENTLIPHGDTIFEAGDQLTAFMRTKDLELLQSALDLAGPVSEGKDRQQA
ncbi:MAG: chloride channel protein, partial [Anaerolineales bacterium]